MRLPILIVLLLCAGILPLAQAQDLPACPDDEYEKALETLSAYQVQGAASIESLDQLLAFSQAQIDWRANSSVFVPYCAEMLEIQTLLIDFNSDFVARAGLELAGVPAESNPYLRLPSDQERAAAASQRHDAPQVEVELPLKCSQAQIQEALHEHTGDYTIVFNMLREASVINRYIDYIEAQIEWREGFWRELPFCSLVTQLGQLMQKILSGYASFLALHYAGLPQEENPYWAQIQADRSDLQRLTMFLLQRDQSEASAPEKLASLPACDNTQMNAVFDVMLAYQQDVDSAPQSSLSRLTILNHEWYVLRESRLSELPLCSAAISTRMFLTQLMNDWVARSALDIKGIADEFNPYLRLPSDRERMDEAALAILNAQRGRQSTDSVSALPACTDAQVEHIFEVRESYQDQLGAEAYLDPTRAVHRYTTAYLSWRAEALSDLPACEEAVQFGFALNEFTSDSATYYALLAAGVEEERIAQANNISRVRSRLTQILAKLELRQIAAKS